jgi:hypothetical protein
MDESEWEEIEAVARRCGQTVSEWVRGALRAARREEPTGPVDRKLAALRVAARFDGPTADIDQMLAEIARGRSTELPE